MLEATWERGLRFVLSERIVLSKLLLFKFWPRVSQFLCHETCDVKTET